MQYPPSELVLNDKGQVYHLALSPNQISKKIILVGDQNRVDLVASYFDSVEHSSQHREFACKTGMYNKKRISVISTRIGTDNIDITINELDALANIDLINRIDKAETTQLDLIRIGTCGILQANVPIHSYILTTFAFGLDNVAHFYDIKETAEESEINKKVNDYINLPKEIKTYTSSATDKIFNKLSSDETIEGITITSSGFYGPQGRQLRLNNSSDALKDRLTSFEFDEHKITNFEMESSALFALGKALGHNCATICLGIANRPNNEFTKDYKPHMMKLIKYVLDRI